MSRANDVVRDCFRREAPAIASTKTDLETASTALLARCIGELEAERRAFINLAPGYRDYIEPRLREVEQIRTDQARAEIAVLRAR